MYKHGVFAAKRNNINVEFIGRNWLIDKIYQSVIAVTLMVM